MWIFFYRRNKKIKPNYSLLIEDLKNEQEINNINFGENQISIFDNDSHIQSKVSISNDTEKRY